jgi:alanyl-tRNA synthetase
MKKLSRSGKKYLPESRILPFNMKDNFWEMGDTGPCGPCTEIHYDRIGGRDAAYLVNMDDPDVLEIWNNVFMQFNRETDGSLTELPAKSVDTGMGLERVASVLMDKRSNYDTDLFTKIFDGIQKKTGARAYTGKVGEEDKDTVDMAYRVIADHIRTLTIALTDGAVPSNEGRGYVLRRVLRRAVRYGREILNGPPGFFYQLVDYVLDTLGDAFPELKANPNDVKEIIKAEEEQFGRTLDKGIREFKARSRKGKITAEDAFVLGTSYGFPIDLTVLMAEEAKLEVDEKGYEEMMADFREKSKGGGTFKNRKNMQLIAAHTDELSNKKKIAVTNQSAKYSWDTNGSGDAVSAKIMAIFEGKVFIDTCDSASDVVGLVLDKTSCYAEQGGQTFDTATITAKGAEFRCDDTQTYAGYVLHVGLVKSGSFKVGDGVSVQVDYTRRALVAKNHTCTHMLNFALREVLGEKIDQKGSLVDETKLRFDFSHGKQIEDAELQKIEEIVNREIEKKHVVHWKEKALKDAHTIGGLRAVFGETYPDPVRVVAVGPEVDKMIGDGSRKWGREYSVEFCGGTHVSNAEQIYRFILQVEEGIAKGVRRIVAVTGPAAYSDATLRLKQLTMKVDKAAALKGLELDKMIADCRTEVNTDKEVSLIAKKQLVTKLEKLNEGQKAAGKADKKGHEKRAKDAGEVLATEASAAAGDVFVGVVDAGAGDDSKACSFALSVIVKKCSGKAIFLLSNSGGKLAVNAVVPSGGKLSAKAWTDKVLGAIGGKGGGTDASAVGTASDPSLLDKALAEAKAFSGI